MYVLPHRKLTYCIVSSSDEIPIACEKGFAAFELEIFLFNFLFKEFGGYEN